MNIIRKYIIALGIGLALQSCSLVWGAEAAALEEGLESAVSRGLADGLAGSENALIKGAETQEIEAASESISAAMKDLIESGADESVINTVAEDTAQSLAKKISQEVAEGEGKDLLSITKQFVAEGKVEQNMLEIARGKLAPEAFENFQKTLSEISESRASTLLEEKPLGAGQTLATVNAVKELPTSAEDALKDAQESIGESADSVNYEKLDLTTVKRFSVKSDIVKGFLNEAADATGIPAKRAAMETFARAADTEVSARAACINAAKDITPATDNSGLSNLKLRGYGEPSEPITTKPGNSIKDVAFDGNEFTLTMKDGELIRIPRKGALSALKNPEALDAESFDIIQEPLIPGEKPQSFVVLRFNEDDPKLFGFNKVNESGVVFKDYSVDENYTTSFKDLSNSGSYESTLKMRTELQAKYESLTKTLGKMKSAVTSAAKWGYGKLKDLASTIGHGLMQAVVFTVPNILEQARVQSAQIAEQWLALTSVQTFGNLHVQIPAFLIPKAAPTSGVFLYIQVPADAPVNEPNNFDEKTLLSGMYYVSKSDQYTPWGLSYIPQVSMFVNLNTGFVFTADGSAISEQQEFVALMKDNKSTQEGKAGDGPVITYLESTLGKGIGNKVVGTTHLSSWRDWLPFGKVATASIVAQSNPALAFLFDDIKDSRTGEVLPPAIFDAAINQFLKKESYVGEGACSAAAANESASDKCMERGVNGVEVRQVLGLGSAVTLLNNLANQTQTLPLSADLTTTLQKFLSAQQDLVNGLLVVNDVKPGDKNMEDANARKKALIQKLVDLNQANNNLSNALSSQKLGSQGVSPEVFIHALGMYVYETTDTPIAQFMIKHSPLPESCKSQFLKDYVVFLDSSASTVLPLYNAEIDDKGEFRYVTNSGIAYMASLVSGRTYQVGPSSTTKPVKGSQSVIDIATTAWSLLFDPNSGIIAKMDAASGGQTGAALARQITAMTAYASTLISDGPYTKNGYAVTKVDLLPDLESVNEQITAENLFDQTATLLTPVAASTIKTILPEGVDISSVGAIKINQQISPAQKRAFAGQDGNGIMIYQINGALGVDEQGNPIHDYVIALSLSASGIYVIMPLSASAFPSENNGISALVSLITGKVFTADYLEQQLSWLVQVPLRYASGSSAGNLVTASANATQTLNGTGVVTIPLPIATAFMPTALNPYNYVPENQQSLNEMQALKSRLTAAVTAYQASPNDATDKALRAAGRAVENFNKQIANGSIPVTLRLIHPAPVPGDLLYMSDYYWGYYAGYNVCSGAQVSANAQGSTPPTMWSTDNVCPSTQALAINMNGTNTAISLFDALPISTVKMLAGTFGRWFNAMLRTSPALDSFETGPFNFTNKGKNDLYIMANLTDVKNGNFFYQAVPDFDTKDLLVLGQLKNTGVLPAELSVDDFVTSSLGQSFAQLTNPVLIDLKNGYVFMPKDAQNNCSGSVLCNLALSRIYDIPAVITQVLANQGTTLTELETKNAALAQRLQDTIYQFEVNLQTMLTQNYFAGKQLLLNPETISSYIYAVTPAPAQSGYGNTSNEYIDQIAAAYQQATDFWVCFDGTNIQQEPINSSTASMVSLVTGNKYSPTSGSPVGNTGKNDLQSYSAALLNSLKNVPSFLTAGYIETLAQNYLAKQVKQAFVQPPVDLSVPTSFFAGLTQVPSTQFDNLYQNNGQYALKISMPTVVNNNQTITLAPQEEVNYFVFNQVGASSDTGAGYYYPAPGGTVTASSQSAGNDTMIEPVSVLQGFNLQSMRAHYGVNVDSKGVQTLVLPMVSEPLPMAANDSTLKPATSGTYMQYLGSITPTDNTTEKDYYYQNTLAQNFLMRRVITTPLSAFAQKATQAATGTMKTDYYLDLISGNEFNVDGTPRLKQVAVAYTHIPTRKGSNGPLNLTNPLFVWGQQDPTTGLTKQYAMFQQFDTNGYQLYTPELGGTSYDVQVGGGLVRYSYQLSSSGNVIGVIATPILNNQAGLQATLGTAKPAGTDMKTVLQQAGGALVSINTTFADTSQMYQMVSVPSIYTFVPASSGVPYVFTQVIPGVTTAQAATTNATNNEAFVTDEQVSMFIEGIPFVATLTGQASAAQGQTTMVGAPSSLSGSSYYVCGLLSPQGGLLSMVSYYPGTGSSTGIDASTQSCPSNSSSCVTPGRYYFYANQNDSRHSNLWVTPQKGTAYTQNYVMLLPMRTPGSQPHPTPATMYGGTFQYALTALNTASQQSTAATSNALAPATWAEGATYLALMPQQLNAESENVAVTSAGSQIYNFMYSSIDREALPLYNNNVQVVTTMEGQNVLVAPIPSGLPGQTATPNASASNTGNISYYSGDALVSACSLYQVTGQETMGSLSAPFNAAAPTYTTASSSSAGPTTPFVAPGSLIDIATGVVYVASSGKYYPLDVPAPQGSTAFIKNMFNIISIDKTGKIVVPAEQNS